MTVRVADAEAPSSRVVHHPLVGAATVVWRWVVGAGGGLLTGWVLVGIIMARGVPIHAPSPPFISWPLFAAVILGSVVGGVWFTTRAIPRVTVGSDGVSVRRGYLGRGVFASFAGMDCAECAGSAPGLATLVVRFHGEPCGRSLGVGPAARVDLVVEAIRTRLAAWRASAEAPKSSPGLALDAPDVSAWVRSLRERTSDGSTYRDTAIPSDELGHLLTNPSASPAQRLGAAVVLIARRADGSKERLRIAAASTANPKLRIALESIANDDDRAIEEHIAAAVELRSSR